MKNLVLAAAFCAAGGQASAGPFDPPATEGADPAAAWSGYYAGISVGSGNASDDGGVTDTGTDPVGLQFGYLRDLGTFVTGGELAYAEGGFDDFPAQDWNSTRLKVIGGYDAGAFLPYGFAGLAQYEVGGISDLSDTVVIYGLGAKYAISQRTKIGVEYLVEKKDDYDNTGGDLENDEASLRLDFNF